MAQPVESLLSVRFPALGNKETRNLASWSIDSSFLVSTDGFEFELFDPEFTKKNRLELQPVELLVNGASQLVGRIDITDIGSKGRAVTCLGRDYIADFVEGNVDPKFKLKSNMTVDDMLTGVLGPYGVDTIFDDTDSGVIMQDVRTGTKTGINRGKGKKLQKLLDHAPKPGQGAYDYCNFVVARCGAILQPGPTRRSLCITEPHYDARPLYSIYRSDDPAADSANNVLTSRARRDFGRMPTFSLFSGTRSAGSEAGKGLSKVTDIFDLAAVSDELMEIINASTISGRWEPGQLATEVAEQGKLYRLLNFRDEAARSKEQLDRITDRAIAERLKDTLAYECTVRGHVDPRSGAIWSVDTMVRVDDDICGVHEVLWIYKRTLSYTPGQGAETRLSCWRPGSFILDRENEKVATKATAKPATPPKKPAPQLLAAPAQRRGG